VNNGAVRFHARVKKSRDHRFDGKPLRKTSLTNDGNLAGYSIKSKSEHCECRNESDKGCGLGDVAATKHVVGIRKCRTAATVPSIATPLYQRLASADLRELPGNPPTLFPL
jgi:hypothetical protein